MAVLLIILLLTVALGIRAGVWDRRWTAADSESNAETGLNEDMGLVDTCTRTFALVLISLIGLFALGVTYGNVLGASAP
jgi:hypothetical protein